MKLTFKVFGHEVATLDLEMGEEPVRHTSVAEKAVKSASRWWVGWMSR